MHYVHQDGRQVFKYAVRRTYETTTSLLGKNGFHAGRRLAPHRPSGERPHPRRHPRAARAARGESRQEHPEVRQHHRRDDPARALRRARGRPARPAATSFCSAPSAPGSPRARRSSVGVASETEAHEREPTRRRDQPLSAATRGKPRRLVPVGRRSARALQRRGQTDPALGGLLRVSLVSRDGARVVRERRDRGVDERALRVREGRSRRAARRRRDLHERGAVHDRLGRVAAHRIPHAGAQAVLWRHLLPARRPLGPARVQDGAHRARARLRTRARAHSRGVGSGDRAAASALVHDKKPGDLDHGVVARAAARARRAVRRARRRVLTRARSFRPRARCLCCCATAAQQGRR